MKTYKVTCVLKNEYRLGLRFETDGAEPLNVQIDEVDIFSSAEGRNKVVAAAHDLRALRKLLLKDQKLELVLPHTIRVLPDFFSSGPDEVLFVEKQTSGRGQTWTTLCIREDIAKLRLVGEPEKMVERMDDLNTFMGRVVQKAVIGLLCDLECVQTLADTRKAFPLRVELRKAREALATATEIASFDKAAKDARDSLQALSELKVLWNTATVDTIIKRGE